MHSFDALQLKQFIAGTYLFWNGDGDTGALQGFGHRTVIAVDLCGGDIDNTRGRPGDEQVVTWLKLTGYP